MLRACVADRARVPASQITDVRFHELLADGLATVERVYRSLGEPPRRRALRFYHERFGVPDE